MYVYTTDTDPVIIVKDGLASNSGNEVDFYVGAQTWNPEHLEPIAYTQKPEVHNTLRTDRRQKSPNFLFGGSNPSNISVFSTI